LNLAQHRQPHVEDEIWADGTLVRVGPHGGRVRLRDSITEVGFPIRTVPFEDRERLREGCAVRFVMKDQNNVGRVVPAE
jgi:hypothetical protein